MTTRPIIESTGGSFPAACREFVIPAEAGIQRARLDSPVSSTGQACQARNDGPERSCTTLITESLEEDLNASVHLVRLLQHDHVASSGNKLKL